MPENEKTVKAVAKSTPKEPKVKVEATPKVEVVKEEIVPPVETPPEVKKEEPIVVAEKSIEVAAPVYNAAMDPKKSHKERIVAFLESRKGAGIIRLNYFLKSLYPLPKPNFPAEWTSQGAMKKLRHDLKELQAEGKIFFVSNHFERLSKAHFPDTTTGKTHYWDLSNLIIEVEIS